MEDFIITVIALVKADVGEGKPVNVDEVCRQLAYLYPGKSDTKLRDVVIEVVGALGGAAEWGTEPPTKGPER